ncbi:diguanylate cyclase [Qipengyuania aurantiaca]|uniref:diguanylate cyclase n=1 Tax=Qipengyuania aurantiaca TaxID=2867233 RepID=A0ABX8ZK82_9SPHN|nr:diguanylate cyclase [Qipengyuania aurantiaca]QZD89420.1 diguanylate cyclase [Qipengyuania aurantiaca]
MAHEPHSGPTDRAGASPDVDPRAVQQETMLAMLERERRSLSSSLLAMALLALSFAFYALPGPFYLLLGLRLASFTFTRRAAALLNLAVRENRRTTWPHRRMMLAMGLTGFTLAMLLLPAPAGTPFAAQLLVGCVVLVALTLISTTLAAMRGPRDMMLASFFLTMCVIVPSQLASTANMWIIAVAAITVAGIRMYAYNAGEHIITSAAVLVENRLLSQDLAQALAKAEYLGACDPLTGLYNRRKLFEQRERAADGGLRQVLMIDLDRFKSINDKFGHSAGDRVLVAAADAIGARLDGMKGSGHMAFRLGGEEFVALLQDTDCDTARRVAEALRGDITQISAAAADIGALETTASIGIARWHPGEELDEALQRADAACYAAKNAGRNRVQAAA